MSLARSPGIRRLVLGDAPPPSFSLVTVVLGGTIALAAVVGLISLATARSALLVVGVAAASLMLVRRVWRRAPGSRRVIVVGSHGEVSSYTATAGPHVVVGAVVSGPDDAPVLPFPTTTSFGSLPELAAAVGANAVLVLPAAGGTGSVFELAAPRTGARLATAGDRLAAAVLLLVASPLLALLWAAVRLDSPGPAFDVATRIGRDGRPFRMFSLRTLRGDAGPVADVFADQTVEVGSVDHGSGSVAFLIRPDPRVTRVGYWLRRWSLDELPRLLNVVRGEMSLGGPSPEEPRE